MAGHRHPLVEDDLYYVRDRDPSSYDVIVGLLEGRLPVLVHFTQGRPDWWSDSHEPDDDDSLVDELLADARQPGGTEASERRVTFEFIGPDTRGFLYTVVNGRWVIEHKPPSGSVPPVPLQNHRIERIQCFAHFRLRRSSARTANPMQ